MSEKDWKKDAWVLHMGFHRTMDELEALIREVLQEIGKTKEERDEIKKKKEKIINLISNMHSLFDTLVMWIEKLSDEKLRLEGALGEARRPKPFTPKLPPFTKAEMGKTAHILVNRCAICGKEYIPCLGSRLLTCSEECHRKLIEKLVKKFGEFKKVVDKETGIAHKVPTREILEHGLKYEDLKKYPVWEEQKDVSC